MCWCSGASVYDFLTTTNLLGALSNSTKAVLLLNSNMSHQAALAACNELHESLVHPDFLGSSFDLTAGLTQQINGRLKTATESYWIASTQGLCQVTDAYGTTRSVDCDEQLPVLCTQSAPFSNISYFDSSISWQTKVETGVQTITG